ncbi:(2Fe-2S)-binding protein [Propionivibrio dicarboxylicus]|uniref:Isoquinoline 1-oxidoreductase, alpha subunit n=1 Tax=Propionivibrio dicarboxylicus TaxID=83767 RepID=A0A1G8J1X7_9RHOO|nr:(2Fe-2S)-binding protein [Propionivibrio dicarboxylicus]SDI25062.1 isoquinoline 1-oxidoreductase, alpha subunit [Propionivibrio dicarboxylicus]
MGIFTLVINGARHDVDVAPETPLLWVLRDTLGLVGTKFGCGIGECGACIVHLDDVPAKSCRTTVASVGKRRVTTIEGLGQPTRHPLQQAWVELDVPQCGFCQPGQLMSAAALLRENPQPTDKDIEEALAGNLCRCGTYPRIVAGVHRAAEIAAATPAGKKERT